MQKKFKHKKTGEIAIYQDGILKSSGFCVEIGVEPSKEFWEEILDLPVGTKAYNSQTQSTIVRKEDGWYKIPADSDLKTSYTDEMIYTQKSFQIVEEVKKDYEILRFQGLTSGLLWVKQNNGLFSINTSLNKLGTHTEEYLLQEGLKIQSVKRLSDNEVFTIGDICNPITPIFKNNSHPITKFELILNNTKLRVQSKNWYLSIENIEKSKPILFTTEDGVDIKEGEKTYRVSKNSYLVSFHKYESNKDEAKYFSTKEAAEEYIILNKPCLSLNEVKDIIYNFNRNKSKYDALKELVKSKL